MSSENLSVLAYNVADGLGDNTRIEAIVRTVEELNPTIAVFSEAYRSTETGPKDDALQEFDDMGYYIFEVDQEVSDKRPDPHAVLVIAKKEQSPDFVPVQLAGRFALMGSLYVPFTDQRTRFIGHHGNDKNEASRMADTSVLLTEIPTQSGEILEPTVLAGDLNRMSGLTTRAQLLRMAGGVANLLPAESPDPNKPKNLKYKFGLVQRLGEMARGDSYAVLEEIGLRDVDPKGVPTIRKAGIAATLDYIMHSNHFYVENQEVLSGLTVDGDTNGKRISDHDAKRAELHLFKEY